MLTRRSIFKLAGAGAVAAAGCRPGAAHNAAFNVALDKPYVPGSEQFGTHEERWIETSCAQCPAACGTRVRVVEGRAVRIEGNPQNPLNRGGIGPRGLAALQALYDADRLTGPMRRENGALVPVSWDDAIAELVGKLSELRTTGEAHRLLVMSGRERGFVHELLTRFCGAYGTSQLVEGARTTVLAQAMEAATGVYAAPAYDWGGASHVLSVEAGLLEDSCQSVYFTRMAAELRRGRDGARARITHLGHAYDLCAHNADEWIRIAPGTGGAFVLGVCHVLVAEGLFDADFVHDRSHGFDAFVASLAAYTPAQVAELTGAPASTVERVARDLADTEAAFAVTDERGLAFSNGLETAGAVLALDALLGALGRREGGVVIEPPVPYAAWPALAAELPKPQRSHEQIRPGLTGPDAPRIALLYHANPAWARQQPHAWREALAQLPYVVSFSPYLDETVDEVAHLVLPDHTFMERWEDAAPAPGLGKPVVGIRRPVVAPLHDTRHTGDVILALAHGLGDPIAKAFPWQTFEEAMEARLVGLFRSHRGNIKAKGERDFLATLYQTGFWSDLDAEPELVPFAFPVGWTPPAWSGDPDAYPHTLIAYRPIGYAEGSGANQPWLRHLRGRGNEAYYTTPAVFHPDTLPGVVDGDLVTVTSEHGSIDVPARLDARMVTGAVAVPLGGGHTAFGRWAKGVGANVNTLLAPGPAPGSGANLLCATRVRVERKG